MKPTRRTANDWSRVPVYVSVLLLSMALSAGTAFSDVLDAYQKAEVRYCALGCIRAVERRDGNVTPWQRKRCEELCEHEVLVWMPS